MTTKNPEKLPNMQRVKTKEDTDARETAIALPLLCNGKVKIIKERTFIDITAISGFIQASMSKIQGLFKDF